MIKGLRTTANGTNTLSTVYPELCGEWHPTLNGNLTPSLIAPHSGKKVWWKCAHEHEWSATVRHRAYGRGCPICSGKKASKWRNLKTEFPEVARDWHPTKNALAPTEYLPKSSKVVWWQCKFGHDFQMSVEVRTRGIGCPECRRHNVLSFGNQKLGDYKELLDEVDPSLEVLEEVAELYVGSNRRLNWLGKCGHRWKTTVLRRYQGRKCPYCINQKVDKTNNLAVTFPKIADEWDHKKNGELSPFYVNPGTPRKVHWKCSRGHTWQAQVNSRTRNGTGCPTCNPQTSKTEIRVLTELRFLVGSGARWRKKIGGYEADISFDDHKLVVEVDGYPWHDNERALERDIQKTLVFMSEGYTVFRLREQRLRPVGEGIPVKLDEGLLLESIKNLVKAISRERPTLIPAEKLSAYLSASTFSNEEGYRDLVDVLPGPEPQDSLKTLFPEIAKEWDFELNSPLTPEKVSRASGFKAYWKCVNGHSWQALVAQRTTKKTGCPYCHGLKFDQKQSFGTLYPLLVKEWHTGKNEKSPYEVSKANNYRAWWKCSQGHEWQASIGNRVRQNTGCPYCAKKLPSSDYNFAVASPELLIFFDKKENAPMAPSDFTPKSEKKVVWTCSQGHTWIRTIANQVKAGPVCQACRKFTKEIKGV